MLFLDHVLLWNYTMDWLAQTVDDAGYFECSSQSSLFEGYQRNAKRVYGRIC